MLTAQEATFATFELIRSAIGVEDALEAHPDDPGMVLSDLLDVLAMMSTGEQVVVNFAWALWNGNRNCAVADLFKLDRHLRAALADILRERING